MKLTEANAPDIFIPTKKPQLVESADGSRSALVCEGIFSKINARNENNRRYPMTVFRKNLAEGSAFRKRMQARSVLGELEHPESGNTHLERVSHLITDAWIEELTEQKIKDMNLDSTLVKPGTYVLGKYEVLNTPRGGILRALHEANVRVGISSRGRGDVRNVDGVDEVCDDYELDTWDTVYMPSVVEANPSPKVVEQAGGLGSQLPSAAPQEQGGGITGIDSDVTPNNAVPGNWKPEAEEIVRALEDTIAAEQVDIVKMVELLPRGVNLIDQLASLEDEEAIKLKSQALSLIRVLTNKITAIETGKMQPDSGGEVGGGGGGEKKPPKEKEGGEKKEKEKEEKPKKKEKEEKLKKKEEESVEEGTFTDLASSIAKERQGGEATMFKGDIEAELNKAGHEPTDVMVTELANELRAQGMAVDAEKYEHLGEATKEKMDMMVDGSIVSVSAKNLLKRLKEHYEDLDAECPCAVKDFLEKQEDDVLVRICSKGGQGYVVRLLEPSVGESNIFVKYGDVKPAQTESTEKEEEMNLKKMLEELVRKNDELQKQLEAKGEEGVPKIRYEAAKKLIGRLVEKLKDSNKTAAHESKRVAAATKLLHKLVNERKGKEPEKEVTTEGKKDKRPAVTERKETKSEETPAAEEEKKESKEEKKDAPSSLDEALATSAMDVRKERQERLIAAPEKITEDSADRRKRIRGKKPATVVEAKPRPTNVMEALNRKLQG